MKFSKNSLLMSSMLAASVMAFSTTAAQAQDADNDEIVVTGSRLNVNPNALSMAVVFLTVTQRLWLLTLTLCQQTSLSVLTF